MTLDDLSRFRNLQYIPEYYKGSKYSFPFQFHYVNGEGELKGKEYFRFLVCDK